MRNMKLNCWLRWAGVVLVATFVGTASGQSLPGLPQELALTRGEGSPGKVIFNHRIHVDQKRPDCTVCHPALFRILEKGPAIAGAPIRHAEMEQGRACGACHNEKAAFGLANCMVCHRGG